METTGSNRVPGSTDDWAWDQRVEDAADEIVVLCHRLGAAWWPTSDDQVHMLLVEALSRSARLLLAEQPTLTFD